MVEPRRTAGRGQTAQLDVIPTQVQCRMYTSVLGNTRGKRCIYREVALDIVRQCQELAIEALLQRGAHD